MDLNWNDFNAKNKDKRHAFENLCRTLFLRQHKKTGNDYSYDYNHPGLETSPVYNEKDGKWYGFQCKYFDSGESSTKKYDEIYKSVKTAIDSYSKKKELDCVYIYTNGKLIHTVSQDKITEKESKGKGLSSREKLAKLNIVNPGFLQWKKADNILDILKEESNFDLLKLYFDKARILAFLDDLVSEQDITYIDSDEYLNLRLNNRLHEDVCEELSINKTSVIMGSAGTGKTLLLKKVYLEYTRRFYRNFFSKAIGANKCELPIIIKLNNCNQGDLTGMIRSKLSDYSMNHMDREFDYLYLLDGLDELPYEHIIRIADDINEIVSKPNKRIIISSRTDSPNYSQLIGRMSDIKKYVISGLSVDDTRKYFSVKSDGAEKFEKLNQLYAENGDFFHDIDDVLSIVLLWENIEKIQPNDTKISLLSYGINRILDTYRKPLRLGMLEPVKDKIIHLCKQISFNMALEGKLKISLEKTQNIIISENRNILNTHINNIIDTLCEMFLEKNKDNLSFSHRRYQEYFLYLLIKDLYFEDPSILRKLNLLSNPDFIVNIFISQMVIDIKNMSDVGTAARIGMLESYLGDEYLEYGNTNYSLLKPKNLYPFEELYTGSEGLLYLLSCYEDKYLESLLTSKSVGVSNFVGIYTSNNVYKFLETYHREKDQKVSKELVDILNLHKLVKNKTPSLADVDGCIVYCDYRIAKRDIEEVYQDYRNIRDGINTKHLCSSGKVYGEYSGLYRVFELALWYEPEWCANKIESLIVSELELVGLTFLKEENIHLLFNTTAEMKKLKDGIIKRYDGSDEDFGLYMRTLYCLIQDKVDEKSKDKLAAYWNDVSNQNHVWTWNDNYQLNHAVGYLLGKTANNTFNFARLGFNLFLSYYTNYKDEDTILNDWVNNIVDANFKYSKHLKYTDSSSLGRYLSNGEFSVSSVKKFVMQLLVYQDPISIEAVLWSIYKSDKALFLRICNKSLLKRVYDLAENNSDSYEDQLEVDFRFATFFYIYDKEKSSELFLKGVNNSFLRPIYRKENLVDSLLVCCLSVAYINSWLSDKEALEYADRVYQMLKVLDNTRDQAARTCYIRWFLEQFFGEAKILEDIYVEEPEEHWILRSEGNISVSSITVSMLDELFKNDQKSRQDLGYDLGTWERIISHQEFDLSKLLEFFDAKYFPMTGSISPYSDFYLPLSVLLKRKEFSKDIRDFLIRKRHRETGLILLMIFAENSDSDQGKSLLEYLFKFSEMLVYHNNQGYYDSSRVEIPEVLDSIYNSKSSDWEFSSDNIRTFKTDRRVEIHEQDEREICSLEWAVRFPDEKAYRIEYDVFLNGQRIESFALAAVDGYRAQLPFPNLGTMVVSRDQYYIAKLFNTSNETYHTYLRNAGLLIK